MKVHDQLHEALAELQGKHPDEIAALMRKRGIKGRAGTTAKCPLAEFFNHTHTGRFVIGQNFIMRIAGKVVEKAKTPSNLRGFVRRFDKGDYADLMAPPPRCLPKRKRAHDRRTGDRHKVKGHKINHFAKDVGRFSTS